LFALQSAPAQRLVGPQTL